MAHHVEPMDIDSDFDNKENSLHHNNVLPFTEKGYEELDVSELNMKLRYSVTPVSSPMSKSYTANSIDNRSLESGDDSFNVTVNENLNLSRSLNSTITKNDSVVKTLKALPLQAIPSEQYVDSNRNSSVLRALDTTITSENGNVTVTVNAPSDIDENLSLPSSSSSTLHTPEATTPTKDIPTKDGGSPILRGLKSVLSMFRTSQSPIPPLDNDNAVKPEILSPLEPQVSTQDVKSETVLASTPIAAHRKKEMSPTKRSSPQKDLSIVFNEDLEKELQWKDETTIIFSQERIPIHKLMLQPPLDIKTFNKDVTQNSVPNNQNLNSTVEYMDISFNDSMKDRTVTDIQIDNKHSDTTFAGESDSEFVDCETTFTKNDSNIIEDKDKTPLANKTQEFDLTKEIKDSNDSGSRLKPIILDTTQDILDATLSVRPEDLLPDILDEVYSKFEISNEELHIDQLLNRTTNVTKTFDVLSTTHTFDQKLDATSCDLTNAEVQEEDFDVTITKDQSVNITERLAIEKEEDKPITKTLDVISTTHTIDITSCDFTNAEIQQEDFNVTITKDQTENTITKDQTENIIEGLALEKVEDLNITKTFDVLSTTQTIDQTFDITSCDLTNAEIQKEDSDVTITKDQTVNVTEKLALENVEDQHITKNLDVLSTTQTIDQTFDITSCDLTNEEIGKEDSDVTITKDQTVNVTERLALENVEDQHITKTLDVLSTTQTIDQTFNVTSCDVINAEVQKEDFDVTITKDNNFSETNIDQPNETKNLSSAITNESMTLDIKSFDAETTSAVDNKIEKYNETEPVTATSTNNDPIAPVLIPPSLEEITTKLLLCKHAEMNIVKESSITELPVDVPLPDEDDLDKELNLPNEITNELTTPYALPLDDIKTSTEVTILMNADSNQEKLFLTEDINKEMADTDNENASTIPENGDIINSQTFELNPNAIVNELNETVEATNNSVIEEKAEVPENTSTNAFTTQNTVLTQTKYENTNNIIENTDKRNDIEVPMDINESIGDFKLLPDVINQTLPFTENVEPTAEIHKAIGQVVEKTEDNKSAQPLVECNNLVEELIANKSFTFETENQFNQLNEVTKASISEHEITITKDSIPSNENVTVVEEVNMDAEIKEQDTEIINTKAAEEEIIVSENSSPFVSVTADDFPEMKLEVNTDIETVTETVDTRAKVLTPPCSPPIKSKGYNFNFDDLDFDPFATKTNIRTSPPLDSPNKPIETNIQAEPKSFEKRVPKKDNNRRKSQPERKRPTAPKRKFNSTFDGTLNDNVVETLNRKPESSQTEVLQLHSPNTVALSPSNVSIEEKTKDDTIEIQPETLIEHKEDLNPESETIMKGTIDQSIDISAGTSESSINIKLKEVISSSEQSTYYSAGTSSSDTSIQSRNVFNLPEIDDMNFNPFATKSKMRQSPPLDLEENPFIAKSKITNSPDSSMIIPQESKDRTNLLEDKIENEPMEKEVLGNLSNVTTSSKATDENHTTSDSDQIRTEDEDTVEGPFLEAEDLNTDDKILDFDSENIDMMQFTELPTQSNEENVDNGELFIDAEAFEFLLNQNKCNTVVDSGKESLFLKFDPLFAKRMSAVTSDGVVASLARLQRKQSTPTKAARTPPKNMPSPIPGPSNLNVSQDIDMNTSEELNDDLNITVSKPMMVVPPAVNPVTPRNKSLTPNRSNRHSITFTSPAMAVIDRLLSLSSNNSFVHDTTVTHVSREQNEADIALSQLRELLAEKEISVYQLRTESRDLKDRLSSLESNVKSLENVCEDRLKKINQLNDTLAEKTKINRSMAAVVEEYERTIASLIAETAQDKKRHAEERIKLINERDEQTAHLTSMEVSFSDLHSKYEKSKQVILNCKANEDAYKKSIKDFEENFTKMQNNYELLKQHATSKLNHANQEMEKINRSHEAEVLKLNAMIKRKELHITSLEESLNQKTKANEELTAICDELINKVG